MAVVVNYSPNLELKLEKLTDKLRAIQDLFG
jgi:hypothetical protein